MIQLPKKLPLYETVLSLSHYYAFYPSIISIGAFNTKKVLFDVHRTLYSLGNSFIHSDHRLSSDIKFVIGFNKADEAGQFGDQYGALNCFISGLAFIGLVLTLILQREDLNMQRKEMEDTRIEFKKQTEQFNRQTNILEQQIIEGRTSVQKQLDQQKKTVWMHETLELISRLEEQVKSLRCTYGEASNNLRTAVGYEVVKLLYDAVTEKIAYNYFIQSIQR